MIYDNELLRLEKEISELPIGSISKKNIKGKNFYYHRWYENGKKVEKYIPYDELDNLYRKIEYRKYLQNKKKEIKNSFNCVFDNSASYFLSNVKCGFELKKFVEPIKEYKCRKCIKDINDYLYSNDFGKVLILCGLRRTGKTTLIKQAIFSMNTESLLRTAFIQTSIHDDFSSINNDLKQLEKLGYQYVFIDEITAMKDFIEGAALLSDVYASSGMKIVLSGTDSLGFILAHSEQLYDRSILIHTTHIPYEEFENVLGIKGIDEYIRYGGTMSISGKYYNEHSIFSQKEKADEYIDSAIAHNIQHSLKYYDQENHFRHLRNLYENNELTNSINRVVEDISHRFTLEVLNKDFESNDFKISRNNLRKDRNNPTDILDKINIQSFTKELKNLLEIKNKSERLININEYHIIEIKEYLKLLDLIDEIEVRTTSSSNAYENRVVISQPGLRYVQASSLIQSLMKDYVFNDLTLTEKNRIIERILNEIKGRMMEDIILLETKNKYPKKEVFVLKFAIGEFDMVVFDPCDQSCEIYEIKHSDQMVPEQYRFLIEEEKLKKTIHQYGNIKKRCVLYRGKTLKENEIDYINVEEYLKSLR